MKSLRMFAQRTRAVFPGKVAKIFLFGSKARGDDHPESDLDLLVTVSGLTPKIRNKIYDLAVDIEEENNYLIQLSPLVWDQTFFERLLHHERRIALDIQKEGILL